MPVRAKVLNEAERERLSKSLSKIEVNLSAVRSWLSGKVQPGYRQLWKVYRVFGRLPFK